ncbi:hypothetical protein VTN96DRAFT_275 [Rasamsonia emersonii]
MEQAALYGKPVLVSTGIIFSILPTIVVALRFFARRVGGTNLGPDDWIMIPALLICIAMGVIQIIAAERGGLGQHQILGPNGELIWTPQLRTYEHCKYALQVLGTLELGVIKASILLFYRRLFTLRKHLIINNVVFAVVVAWGVAFTLVIVFQCLPVSTIWTQFEIDYTPYCINQQAAYMGLAVSDLILDLLIFALPVPVVIQLRLPLRQKFAVGGIFLLGSVVVAAGITRVVVFAQVIAFAHAYPLVYFTDITYFTADTLFWTLLENSIGIIGACLPALRPLFVSMPSKPSSWATPSYNRTPRAKNPLSSTASSRPPQIERRSSDDDGSLSALRDRAFRPAGHAIVSEARAEVVSLQDIPANGIRVKNDFHSEVA